MENLLRIASIVNRTPVVNPKLCADSIIKCIDEVSVHSPDIILLPAYALGGASLGNLKTSTTIIQENQKQLKRIYKHTRGKVPYIILGLLTKDGPVSAVIGNRCSHLPSSIIGGTDGPTAVYRSENKDIANAAYDMEEELEMIYVPKTKANQQAVHSLFFNGATIHVHNMDTDNPLDGLYNSLQNNTPGRPDIILISSFASVTAGTVRSLNNSLKCLSENLGIGIVISNGGINETSFPNIYKGYSGIFECGETLSFSQSTENEIITIADLDLDIILANRKEFFSINPSISQITHSITEKTDILREIRKTPYLPINPQEEKEYLQEFFELQAHSLATRLKNTNIQKMVIGISGGLDSTLALLVSAKAMDTLGLPRYNIEAITMPGFGTTNRTYTQAIQLIQKIGAAFREIPINNSISQHFQDIGQDINTHDVTYENAQARERTQILLDVANMIGGLVVGTGDLSEEALGFSTFAGDHMANYNVNVCATKSMIRKIVEWQSQEGIFAGAASVITEILSTPVSPELLPPDKEGNSGHKTEEILGPYELHDFFTYYFAKFGFSPKKLYAYACKAFADELEPGFIKDKLRIFFKRFFSAQFKRSCAPDSASITDFNLMGNNFYIPSDCDPAPFLQEVDAITL